MRAPVPARLLLAALVCLAAACGGSGNDPPSAAPATTAAEPAPATTARPAPKDVTVTLRYSGASWTRVTTDGRVAFEGTPGPSERRTFKARRSLDLVLGYPAGVSLTVNGHDLGVADTSGNVWRRSFTPGSRSLG